MEKTNFHSGPTIYTTGAFLNPVCVVDDNGKESWFWYISEFTDDSFRDGNVFNPPEMGSSKEELFRVDDED